LVNVTRYYSGDEIKEDDIGMDKWWFIVKKVLINIQLDAIKG
jgi:hypothetical protein